MTYALYSNNTGDFSGGFLFSIMIMSMNCSFHFTYEFTHAICVLSNKKFDCNLLNNRFLKKKKITMGNDIEMSKTL